MRTLSKDNDPILSRANLLSADWFPVNTVGITYRERRVLFYAGVFIMFAIIFAPTFLFALDPIVEIKKAVDQYGGTVVVAVIVFILLTMPLIHEALHIAIHPDLGRSDATIFSGNLLILFVLYDEPMSRNRMLIYLLMPFIGITLFLGLLYVVLPLFWPVWVLFFACHVAMCTGDMLLTWKLLRVRKPLSEVWNCATVLMARYIKH
jgi:hypothetical protein